MSLPEVKPLPNDEVPIIDLKGLWGSDAERLALGRRIVHAAKNSGFFYLINHGVPQSQIDDLLNHGKRFFALPIEQKMDIALAKSANYRGYLPMQMMGKDPSLKGNLHEGFQIHLELPEDDPDVVAGKPLHGPNQWPAALPGLRAEVQAYYDRLQALCMEILQVFAIGLDLPKEAFLGYFRKPMGQFRFLHYPPQEPSDPGEHLGVRAHTDSGAFTMLIQDEVGGLEILGQSGDWVAVPPVPGSYVVNIGEMMKVWTDGIFAATPHRVINRYGQERYSMPFFATPDFDAVILPMMHNPDPVDHPEFATSVARGKAITCGEILDRVYSRIWPSTRLQRSDAA